jgi:hypothetical protein
MTWLAVLGGGEVLSCGGEMGRDGIGTRVRNCFNILVKGEIIQPGMARQVKTTLIISMICSFFYPHNFNF